MVEKTKKFCKNCGVMRPIELFPYRDSTQTYRVSMCLMHSDLSEVPEHLQELVIKERGLWRPDPAQLKRRKRRAVKRQVRKAKKDAYIPVVHEKRVKRRRQAAARVALRPVHMTRQEYSAYLESEHWTKFRCSYQENPNVLHECFVCGDKRYDLHHWTYDRVGREGFSDVVPLCAVHHRAVHKAVKAGVGLTNAHTYVKMRYQRGELSVRKRSLTTEKKPASIMGSRTRLGKDDFDT